MDRVARQHRREAAVARRRQRIARGKRRLRPYADDQGAARAVIAEQNLENLMAMAGIHRSRLRIFRIRKPRLVHVSPATRIRPTVAAKLISGGTA